MSDTKPEPVRFGTHEFQFIPPNRVYFVLRGVFDDADAEAYLDFVFKSGDECGGLLYSVYDMSTLSRATEAGRKRVINVKRAYPYAGMAILGASFSTRALVGMVLTAGRLVAPKSFTFPHKFVSTIDEANAWFEQLRTKSNQA